MQRIGYLFEKVVCYDNLLIAFKKAYKGTKTDESRYFEFNLEKELLHMKKELENERYTPQKYRYFILDGLKKREVSVASFRDRVIHHAIVNIIEPIFDRTYIYDSYATRRNKGLLKGVKRVQGFIKNNNEFYLKTDIEKYFENINHEILLEKIEKKIKDKKLIKLIRKIIKNDGSIDKGLPIGNLTSQFFANIYLNEMDHYLKEILKVKRYVRYMDDFVLIDEDINFLKKAKYEIQTYLENKLNLKLKKEATFTNKVDNGIPFCGVRIFKKCIRIKKASLQVSIDKIKRKKLLFQQKKISEEKLEL